jgi:enterochelin esterase family protein
MTIDALSPRHSTVEVLMLARIVGCLCLASLLILTLSAQEVPQKKEPQPPGKKGKIDNYTFGPDSKVQPGVPQGKWEKYFFDKSEIYPMTTREVWIYVPAQYDEKVPACLMVFQDGPRQFAIREDTPDDKKARHTAEYRTPTVLDNLIHRKELPVIIGVFVNPGSFVIQNDGKGTPDFKNRSVEYDVVSDKYVTFLEKEILPPIEKKYNIRKDAAGRGIGGISSGGICAFTAAWYRPDRFSKVLSNVGSFTNIKGGHVLPKMVRDGEKKPLKVFLQDGENDNLNANPERDWFLQNKAMHEALLSKGYDVKYVLGDGAHNSKHGGAILPESMAWLWREK